MRSGPDPKGWIHQLTGQNSDMITRTVVGLVIPKMINVTAIFISWRAMFLSLKVR